VTRLTIKDVKNIGDRYSADCKQRYPEGIPIPNLLTLEIKKSDSFTTTTIAANTPAYLEAIK
jgi:hypothetical protein